MRRTKTSGTKDRDIERSFSTLIENVNIGIYRNTGGPRGRFLQANPAMAKMFGYDSVGEFLDVPTAQLYQNPEERRQFVRKIQKNGLVQNEELRLRKKDGTLMWGSVTAKVQYNEKGEIQWIDGAVEDITERKRSGERLAQSLEALQSVYHIATTMRSSYEAICDQVVANLAGLLKVSYGAVQHIEEDQIRIISGTMNGKFAHNEAFPLEHTPCAIIYEKREPYRIEGSLQQLFPDYALLARHPFKTYVGVPIKNTRGKVVGSLCIMDYAGRTFSEDEIHLIEIFARYIAYEFERNVMETQLRDMEKMKLLGQMTAGVAHEVRNPLNAILAITEALFQDIGDNPEYEPYLSRIRTQASRLSRLMGDLLELGKPLQLFSLHPESLPSVCAHAIDLWKQTPFSQTHKVRFILPPETDRLNVMADSARLQQVVLNLLENAAQHSPGGSEIRLVISGPKGKTVRIYVIDQGAGIPQEHREKVFEPFFTTRKEGNGLGLSIVKNTILAHNGHIVIRNNVPLPGCTFEISLPGIEKAPL
jgi:PAS domain S-box-containing protein